MKRYDSDDELERALFALDLEEPPADLRASILASTIYREPVTIGIRPWETWLYGALCAVLVMLVILVARGTGAPTIATAESYGNDLLAFISNPSTLLWTAIGGAACFWVSQLNLTVAPGYQRAVRR